MGVDGTVLDNGRVWTFNNLLLSGRAVVSEDVARRRRMADADGRWISAGQRESLVPDVGGTEGLLPKSVG